MSRSPLPISLRRLFVPTELESAAFALLLPFLAEEEDVVLL
jgi:hypothetical protein